MASVHAVPSDWDERVASLAALTKRPWFCGLEHALMELSSQASHLDVRATDRLFASRAGVRFEAQTEVRRRGVPFDRARSYDGSITRRGVVPTREGSMHDLMNAVIWSVYPHTKRALHARQDAALAREVEDGQTALPGRRSRLRDRLSMLDEGGVIVWARRDHARVEHALAHADLDALASLARDGSIGARVIGHAILEHATMRDPRDVRGCVVQVTTEDEAAIDHAIAAALARDDESIERWIARHPSIAIGALFPA
ncbi:MAG: DUF3025 domain-containing protein [Deltaproteobacteria bacterium]|nr:DUF3025 domain-containing protein [Deltaproteobacteria bacterium]